MASLADLQAAENAARELLYKSHLILSAAHGDDSPLVVRGFQPDANFMAELLQQLADEITAKAPLIHKVSEAVIAEGPVRIGQETATSYHAAALLVADRVNWSAWSATVNAVVALESAGMKYDEAHIQRARAAAWESNIRPALADLQRFNLDRSSVHIQQEAIRARSLVKAAASTKRRRPLEELSKFAREWKSLHPTAAYKQIAKAANTQKIGGKDTWNGKSVENARGKYPDA